jgi:predicted PurR-regulated permease PerM
MEEKKTDTKRVEGIKIENKIEEKINTEVKLDVKSINTVIKLTKKLLKISLYIAVILGIYTFIVLGKESGLFAMIVKLLQIIAPLFLGIVIAWLFNPLVKWFTKKGIRRGLAAVIIYIVFIGSIILFMGALMPTLYTQVQEFAKVIPDIFDKVQDWADNIFQSLDGIANFDASAAQANLFNQIEDFGSSLSSTLPELLLSIMSSLLSGIGTILVGLVIGFFLLISFDNTDSIIDFLPKKIQKTTRELLQEIDMALRAFVTGSILDCLFIFVISSIGLYFVGLKAPLLFGLFCGITNIIPYAGPYIGGIPAIIVGFSQGITTGILTMIVIGVIQLLEGNFLQPVILSKTTKLHPVSIILGLLVFGYFWGIFGMVIATPLIASFKAILLFFDEKYDILNFN